MQTANYDNKHRRDNPDQHTDKQTNWWTFQESQPAREYNILKLTDIIQQQNPDVCWNPVGACWLYVAGQLIKLFLNNRTQQPHSQNDIGRHYEDGHTFISKWNMWQYPSALTQTKTFCHTTMH